MQATIRFDEDEHIENVAIGDSQKWQVTPNKRANLLFVKPLAERAATNMTVVTDRHTYLFDLVANPANRNPVYVLALHLSRGARGRAAGRRRGATPADAPTAVELAAATDPYAVVDPAELNFAWATKGDRKLLPQRIYDDGNATFLTWPAGTPMPAILIKDQQGRRRPGQLRRARRDDRGRGRPARDRAALGRGQRRAHQPADRSASPGPATPPWPRPGRHNAETK